MGNVKVLTFKFITRMYLVRQGLLHLRLIHTDRDWGWDRYRDQIKSIVPCRNVHTGRRQRQEPGPIISYCESPISSASLSPIPMQCKHIIIANSIALELHICTCNLGFYFSILGFQWFLNLSESKQCSPTTH